MWITADAGGAANGHVVFKLYTYNYKLVLSRLIPNVAEALLLFRPDDTKIVE